MHRRTVLAGLGAVGLGACASRGGGPEAARILAGETAGTALIVRRGGEVILSEASGFAAGLGAVEKYALVPLRPMRTDTLFRTASISKTVTAMTALTLAEQGALNLEADVQDWFPGLRHPRFSDDPIRLHHLLTHTSTLQDPEQYWIAAPGRIEMLLGPEVYSGAAMLPPGQWFQYTNLNTSIAATILERVSGERFDRLAARLVLQPLGIEAGYNWAGISAERRKAGATLYRLIDDHWHIQADGPDVLTGDQPTSLVEDGFDLGDYQIGSNGTLFSPQGGLRISVVGLAKIAARIGEARALHWPRWAYDASAPNGLDEGGVFAATSAGLLLYPPESSPLPGQRLIGHDGQAYGLFSGCWHVPELEAEIAYVITGTPENPLSSALHPALNVHTETIMARAGKALGVA